MILLFEYYCVRVYQHTKDLFSRKFQYRLFFHCGPGSSVGIAAVYGLGGPGSNPGGDEIFRRPDRPWGLPSLL